LRLSASALLAIPLLAVAIAGPVLLAFNVPPSPTALNQAVAVGGWGLALAFIVGPWSALRATARRGWPIFAALLVAGALISLGSTLDGLPFGLGLSLAGMVMAALTAGAAGAALRPNATFWLAFFGAWLLAGAASVAIGLPQVFAPAWADGDWIARSGIAGRAVGNLRQPNHLATLLLWSSVAAVPVLEWARTGGAGRAVSAMLASLFALLLFGIVLSGSRTGLLGVGVLLLWGLLDSRISRGTRALLIASPLLCAFGWWLLDALAAAQGLVAHLGAAARVGESDLSSGRFSIWRDTLALIAQHPWLGVGFGEFNFAWTLTPFPQRHPQFFDHTHNLPLQLAVELGLPLALLILGLLLWALWQAFDRTRRVEGPEGPALRACFVMVLLMALHSQLEYPLWYAYFLLPTAFAWGLCLGAGSPEGAATAAPSSGRWVQLAGIAMLIGAAAMLWDYRRVVVIFAPGEDAAPLAERIAEGQRSWFFAHHADYALVTTADAPVTQPGAFDRATHYLLDTRLMIAWAQALAAQGDIDRARHLAARLREFRNPGAAPFFAPCDDPRVVEKPFQCQPPERAYDWRDFRR
jgi:O-antigen ligase